MHRPVILVVEDSEIQRKVIHLLASEYGFDVVSTAHCSEACDAFMVGNDVYDVILMDLRLPDIDGVECAKKLREMYKGDNQFIPIVAMTGYMERNETEKLKALGFDDCLIKPFSAKEFREMVQKWSTRRSRESNVIPISEEIAGRQEA